VNSPAGGCYGPISRRWYSASAPVFVPKRPSIPVAECRRLDDELYDSTSAASKKGRSGAQARQSYLDAMGAAGGRLAA